MKTLVAGWFSFELMGASAGDLLARDVACEWLRSAAQVEGLIARTDVVLTTRLHGTVLAIKNGVPTLVIDPVAGGAKVRRQAETLGWPVVFAADALDEAALNAAFDYCLTAEARACADRAAGTLRRLRTEFLAGL